MGKPSCDIYFHKPSETFSIERHAINSEFGFHVSYGDLIHLQSDDMENLGLDLILENLDQFPDRIKTEKSELEKMSRVQQRKFERRRKIVSVCLDSSSLISMAPMHKYRGGHISEPSEEVYVKLPCSNDEFYKKLMETFSKC